MATAVPTRTPAAARSPAGEQRVLLAGVGWSGYEALLKMVGDGHVRLACDGKDVELMSPSRDHEEYSGLIDRIIQTVAEELRIPCVGLGSTTWRKRANEKGLEADGCYYLASLPRIRGRRGDLDLTVDPPPDLAVEVEISRSALDRLGVYAALGVPEVWRFDGETLRVEHLQPGGSYATVPESLGFPAISPDEVVRWVREGAAADDHSEWGRRLREWVRAELLPRFEGR